MDTSVRSTVFRTIEIAWRRRFLLIVPLLIMLPMSAVVAAFLGGTYTARSLVMMQQTVARNPLSQDHPNANSEATTLMLRSLRALLASDFVLSPVVDDIAGPSLNATERASLVKSISQNVSVDLLGNDILEFRLVGSSSNGLGLELQKIMTSLIGALVDPPGQNASAFMLNGLRDDLSAADRAYASLEQRLAVLFPSGLASAEAQLASWLQERQKLSQNLALVDAFVNKPQTKLSVTDTASASGGVVPAKQLDDAGSAGALASKAKMSTQDQIADLNKRIDGLASEIASYKGIQTKMARLAKSRATLHERYDAEKVRLGGESAGNWSSIINAPERMIVVDPPKDPELRTTSGLKFALSGVVGGLVLGVLLVILAEIFDTTIRYADQMSFAGVPIIAQLPPLTATRGSAGGPIPLSLSAIPSPSDQWPRLDKRLGNG